ncbi:uncharacterized protein EI90DRAFT_3073631, partial [Cantharellus anzutake]|uniref:uncharacterized protein n=1 Tax=Cantharellus anzutake TaxID=1750568 RepID=UPI0019079CEE
MRDTTLRWLHELLVLQSHAETETERDRYHEAICQTAAICRSSFDVDAHHAKSLLRTPEDVAIFIECAIVLCNPHLHQLLLRDKRLSCRMEELLGTMLGINKAISAVWSGIDPTYCWTRLPRPNDRWLTTTVNGQRTQNVHFNVLCGALLIDGKSPRNLEVVPSDMEDMDYVSKAHMFHESRLKPRILMRFAIHFGWRDGRLSCRVLELLPGEIFEGDLPSILVKEYLHWMELSTCQIEFRPKKAPWTSSRSNWHLRRTACSTWVMDKGPLHTGEMIRAILRPLEPGNNILITMARSSMQEFFPGFEIDTGFALEQRSRSWRGVQSFEACHNPDGGCVY